ncbi:sigma factor-like helix-turn-helix DNA-binding protein [Carnobacterium divergens]|uniref:sigma factor-like helix-turn-helix DNA-binding protein n=1 Tax=Carnobacterium divergens TaxID=2748 RepID=UPI0007F40171|nr:sigma factor-like helix-turn-helix DNA-binding protein [Carnobacterium divergens]SBO17890.1 Sigma-70, region 4 family protein [Carnobacterium divergens]
MEKDWLNADELIKEYKQELSKLNKIKRPFKNEHELLMEKSKKIQKKGEMLSFEEKDRSIFLRKELKIIGGMISDLQYTIEWLETAREPGTRRTISNRSRYQRTSLLAEIEKLSYLVTIEQENQREATEDEIERITAMLNNLSDKERAAYLAVKGQNLSYAKAGEILGVSKASVQSYVNRAQDKIDNQVKYGSQNYLFDFLLYDSKI